MKTNFILETMRVAGRVKTLTTFSLLAVVAHLLFGILAAKPAHAETFTVNSTGDEPDAYSTDNICETQAFPEGPRNCTLRAAIEQANARPGSDTIGFNIPDDPNVPGNEVKIIHTSADSQLPQIRDAVTIDGYTQPGAQKNTKAVGNDAVLLIELRGPIHTSKHKGLEINAPNSVVRGLAINGYGTGVILQSFFTRVEGNFIGPTASGAGSSGNDNGVHVLYGRNIIGGPLPAARNVISGNGYGIDVQRSNNNIIAGNYIGTTKDGTGDLGNMWGINLFDAKDNFIGYTVSGGYPVPGAGNVIAFNVVGGVHVQGLNSGGYAVPGSGVGNRILGNSIFLNGGRGLGIDLIWGGEGVNPNDPKDPDNGPNNLQNFPELTYALRNPSDNTVTISGKLNSTPGRTFSIQFFSTPPGETVNTPDSIGRQGKTFLRAGRFATDDQGDVVFTTTFPPGQPVSQGDTITATATDEATGDTSEFSNAVYIIEPEWY